MEKEKIKPAPVERVELIVPQRHVKRVKTALEQRMLLNKKRGIAHQYDAETWESASEQYMRISTNIVIALIDSIEAQNPVPPEYTYKSTFELLGLEDIKGEIEAKSYAVPPEDYEPWRRNPFLRAVKDSLGALPPELLYSLRASIDVLISDFPSSYTIYRPMLLLPRNDFTSLYGSTLSKALLLHSPDFQPFWERVAAAVGVTHIAINAGIPLQATPFDSVVKNVDGTPIENIFRSPIDLTPIYGFFGPPPSAQTLSAPTATDFDTALWVTSMQNGIHQTWAPLYTMFSRGNIREKTRLLNLPSVTTSVAEPRGCTAVDLYAGIGYFVFSYKKASVSKVLCWELNPWSIEGLHRGAKLNGWRTQVVESNNFLSQPLSENTDVIIFPHSNEYALDDLAQMQRVTDLPPIRHVNCGFLPSSNLSWRNAVRMLDRELGGWIHAHENVGVNDIEKRKAEVVREMEGHLDFAGLRGEVRCEHVEKVKTYAPGVLHVVFDIWIGRIESLAIS
ncbi:S-adenosylmethionine-dependent methyltransferase [Didymosphaeria variabile]|uniref:tRNA(Phe) (4-demethylwyosine(37)-C(7)) aminocarboxypropyltransferase n=1 Tax=Didymosphaeria variabile TaxID=1932322 RepID=A0A9W9C8Z3_9PLEO|nr:S-adenosylmethionine-dependent methyltransferase [Didymosphaeria variabile]KAJ4351549.1 S-adenosylmethionine-dependent methyltransferase [Didymosphaeria variabile]